MTGPAGWLGEAKEKQMKVNLKMLSESLGLSQTTVSRALNGYSDVSAATRQAIRGRAGDGSGPATAHVKT